MTDETRMAVVSLEDKTVNEMRTLYRLSRSLLGFSKIMGTSDNHGVSFVLVSVMTPQE